MSDGCWIPCVSCDSSLWDMRLIQITQIDPTVAVSFYHPSWSILLTGQMSRVPRTN